MKHFLELAKQFRECPVVDDEFPLLRDRFDHELSYLYHSLPKIVCLCGSTRFWRQFQESSLQETLAGNIVLSIGSARSSDDSDKSFGGYTPADQYDKVKIELDQLHKRKIDISDEVLVLNVGGYIGDSTRSEINYAIQRGVLVRWLEPPSKPVVVAIINEVSDGR